jgi:hypothetical protein
MKMRAHTLLRLKARARHFEVVLGLGRCKH